MEPPSKKTNTIEVQSLVLFCIQLVVSLAQHFTSLPLLRIFDLALILLGLDFVFGDPLRSISKVCKRYKNFLMRVSALCFLIVCLYGGFEFLRSTLLIMLIIPKLPLDKNISKPAATKDNICLSEHTSANSMPGTIPEMKPRRKKAIDEIFNHDEKWLELLDEGCFLCNSSLQLVYSNKKADHIMADLKMNFSSFIKRLAEPQESRRTLKAILNTLFDSALEDTGIKAEFSVFTECKDNRMGYGFVGELLCNYKARVWKLHEESALIIMRKRDTFSTQILAKKLGNVIISTLSHELKTTLNAVMGNISLLADTVDKDHHCFYKLALTSCHVLSSKLNDHFDYFHIQSKEFVQHVTEFKISQLMKDVADVFQPTAQQKQLQFTTQIEPAVPSTLQGDTQRIKQILFSLMGKTIEYTEFGRVVLRAKVNKEGRVELQTRSFGCGMHTALMKNIRAFSPYVKKKKYKRSSPSTITENMEEMYLEIAQLIAKEMGTKIMVKSIEKKVSQFYLPLPNSAPKGNSSNSSRLFEVLESKKSDKNMNIRTLMSVPSCGANPENSDPEVPTEHEGNANLVTRQYTFYARSTPDFSKKRNYSVSILQEGRKQFVTSFSANQSKELLPRSLIKGERGRKEKKRRAVSHGRENLLSVRKFERKCVDDVSSQNILVVDDNMSNRFVLKALLKKCGYNSIEAQNGSDAVSIAKKCIKEGTMKGLQLIFMDLQMPVMNGVEATRLILKLCSGAGVRAPPIIGVSSDSLEEDRLKFEQAGISEFVGKPLDKTKIDRIMHSYVKKSSL